MIVFVETILFLLNTKYFECMFAVLCVFGSINLCFRLFSKE